MQPTETSPLQSAQLLRTPLFNISNTEFLDPASRGALSYRRAKAIALAHELDISDIRDLTPKFWDLNADPITAFDGAATTLLSIQYNLVLGTLSMYLSEREDLRSIVDDLLKYRLIGQFCLTELGHGLDIFHMKTTATMLDDGSFDLHTPTSSDAKFMPPTLPVLGIPCIAIVFARLIVNGEYRGNRPFLVSLNDGYSMGRGVSARQLPPRGGSKPVNHSLTSFDHVILPPTALLGSSSMPEAIHRDFMRSIFRISIGSLALAGPSIPALCLSSNIAALYSIRRHVTGMDGVTSVPIISFSTQKKPVLSTLSLSYVLRTFYKKCVSIFMTESDPRVRRGVAACAKAVIILRSQACQVELSERCGAQGLFEYNQMSCFFSEVRGISIAEGDILGLSIRLVADIIMGKYELPPAADASSLLAKHEAALISECREAMLSQSDSADMNAAFNKHVLPSCQKIVEAIGHRIAYEAAIEAQLPQYVIDLFVANVIRADPSWFLDTRMLSRRDIAEMELRGVEQAMPNLEALVNGLGVRAYITSPIVSDGAWEVFQRKLPLVGGDELGGWVNQEAVSFSGSAARAYL
ncbi:acyl-CoA dehydrogenase NM domain-like protein [Cyathus striatus]|nr:acyl-CoA dehydrogenase NM domain-like protein [Cyathus striatus]